MARESNKYIISLCAFHRASDQCVPVSPASASDVGKKIKSLSEMLGSRTLPMDAGSTTVS